MNLVVKPWLDIFMGSEPVILIVDDIEVNLLLLENIIKSLDAKVIRALSGHEALNLVDGVDLALAIVDVRMPKMNGFEFAKKLNDNRKNNKVPIVFLTANYPNELDLFEGYDSGAVDFLIKPIKNLVLISKIKVFINLYEQKQIIQNDMIDLKDSRDKLKLLNENLEKSETRYRNYIENAPDGVFIIDNKLNFIETNAALQKMTGWTNDEFLESNVFVLFKKTELRKYKELIVSLIDSNLYKADVLIVDKNGNEFWWEIKAVRINMKKFLFFTKDITDRKSIECDLNESIDRLQRLSKHTEDAIEKERKMIASELHDELGQSLTAVKIDLGFISQKTDNDEIKERLDKVTSLVTDTIKTVQKITAQLRPEILEILGLEAAVGWYAKEFSQRNNIQIELDIDPIGDIPEDMSLSVFRIIQESLTNVARHAKASKVEVSLMNNENNYHMVISDNGQGIKDEKLSAKTSFGLLGMRERAHSLGGSFEITKGAKCGTVVNLIFTKNVGAYVENSTLR